MNNLNPKLLLEKELNLIFLEKELNLIFLEVINFLNKINGKVISILENTEGDVHLVCEITTDNSSYFLKVRGKSSKKYDNELLNPKDIKIEKLALDLLYKLFPDNFPKVLLYSECKNYFLMNDVINSGDSFIDFLNGGRSIIKLEKFIIELGNVLGNIHCALGRINFADTSFNYNNRADIILGDNNYSTSIIEELKKEKKQLILGDLSPKNIGINAKNNPVFFDLEHFGHGNCIFEVAFLLSHIYLHLYDLENNKAILNLFLDSYNKINKDFEVNNLFWKIFHSSIIYRVGIIPMKYDVNLSSNNIVRIKEESEDYLK